MIVELTKHAIERAEQRLGIGRRALLRTAQKAFETGVHHDKLTGDLRAWAQGIASRGADKANHVRVVGAQAFAFSDHVLLTVLLVPRELMPKNVKRRRELT